MADTLRAKKNRLVADVQSVGKARLLNAYNEIVVIVKEYTTLNAVEPFNATYFTEEDANLRATKAQFDDIATVLLAFKTSMEDGVEDRIGKLIRGAQS